MENQFSRYIALMDTPFDTPQIQQLRRAAEAQGYGLRLLEPHHQYPEDILRDCPILCGYFPKKLLKQAEALRWLQLPSAGADKYVDEAIYPHENVLLTNSSGAFGGAIGEQLLMGTLMLLRRMPEYQAQQREKVWRRVGPLRFLRGSLVTVIGTGNLGGTFGEDCRAMGAMVRGVSRSGTSEYGCFTAMYPVTRLKEAVRGADVVAACLPLTKETQGLLNREIFQEMRPGTMFLNVGRGKTVCQADLIEALQSGLLGGAMLDVAEVEPMPPECPLWDMDNVILTPHVSGSDRDNGSAIFAIFMDNLDRYFRDQPLKNLVDKQKGY